ncbi:D-glycero-beta-D-manno-heptose 1,7-bisphosphate 7-phosphatase [Arcobacter porcinus]|uniref:D,D-heptose 1,7-bisphosphate phosphatase n=1 Tax=Arcobacter porcinus TaxID=1935204 RepID=A0A1C0AUH2_9BACT|nr:D-glycero-beta-D-manno-heptose 1,7-bisphosphate 7-phosphatase [Arcobacter porcinus]OCL96664.1 D-glycero-beta-D-manno-heptose-1,7-bisphosphate 7-phosphatase [Aliarcobacter thereius]OCL83700.1 D-glycero-beta-D-manno-heptose-1,7-bisphosphate 7-phosphatase [Arcobacter porcinus]OCL83934.1 D-glycero-beta-D-manno-heptose-1,7-bisphosphate 7-phosphatase [Arcobacter porcinus]OCL89925.1 D-glycero-beta-D-manno-heptose-1,7-bisphosphate 7-phosphatase [Arcobacter porcinus]QEP41086.1 D,D-heptose 1,7-bispho
MQKKVIFLDRDGVINKDFGYVSKIENFNFCEGVFEACKEFLNLDFEIVIVTNQSGIGRGYYTIEDFKTLTNHMLNEFKKMDINILKVYFCPHNPDEDCSCRKPKNGMILEALNDFEIDLNNSWLIGDKLSDIECAKNANIPNRVLINEKDEKNKDFFVAKSLFDSLKYIKEKYEI